MAVVSFTISAIDKTRAAFASVQQGLRNLQAGATKSEKSFAKMTLGFSLGAGIMGTALIAAYTNARRVADQIDKIPGIPTETINSVKLAKFAMSEFRNTVDQGIASVLSFGAKIGTGLGFALGALVYGADAAGDAMNKMNEEAQLPSDYKEQIKRVTEELDKERLALGRVNETLGESVDRRLREAEMLRNRAQFGNPLEQAQKQLEATKLQNEASRDFAKIKTDEAAAMREAGNAFNATYNLTLPLKDRIEALQNAYARTNVELAKFSDPQSASQVEQRTKILKEQTGILKQLDRAFEEQNKLAREAGDTIASSFEEAIFAGEGLRGMLRGIAQDLMRLIFRNVITQPLASALTAGIGGMFGFGGPRAIGGPVSAGTSYIVGERGPELFMPSQAGRIIPNHEMSGAGGGGGASYSFTYNIASGVSRAELIPVLKANQRDTISRIADMQRRGMPLGAAMA